MFKTCIICSEDKHEEEFPFKIKAKNLRHTRCKACQSLYAKEHYINNKDDYIARATRDRKKSYNTRKAYINSLKESGCIICEETYPPALDFHHIESDEKEGNISRMLNRKDILAESKKCIVLCANCHRKYHYDHEETINKVNNHIALITQRQR